MELLSKVVVLSIEMMSCDRAKVRVPPATGAVLPPPPEVDVPLPQAARATVATAARPVNLKRVDRVIDCLISESRRGGARVRTDSREWLARAGERPVARMSGTVAFITALAKYFFLVTFGTPPRSA
jgi:hypothetical protein